MLRHIVIAAIIFAGTMTAGHVQAACGRVTIADMNWPSATLIAHVDFLILRHGFGCDAELIPGDTMPTGTSMLEKSEPDIAPELWTNSFSLALDKGVAEQRLRIAGKVLSDGGEEGFWVPRYMTEKDAALATIDGIKKNAKLFKHPEDPSKSAFYGCPAGWNCQISSANLFDALQLSDAGFELIDPGSGAGLNGSLARAYERGKAWFGYYWAPTALLGKYDMVKVDFGTGTDEQHYVDCISQKDCMNPIATMYPSSPVHTVTTAKFAARAPGAFTYLTKRSFTNPQINKLLFWIKDNQADGMTAGIYFLKYHEYIWRNWLTEDVAKNVKAAIARL